MSFKTDNKGIVEYKDKKKVSSFGGGAHVIIPKELIGKLISIHYKRDKK